MVFSSNLFLLGFLPFFLVLNFLTPPRLRNVLLLLASLFFYFWGEELLVVLLVLSATVDFVAGKLIGAGFHKPGLLLSLTVNLSLLFSYKYSHFVLENTNIILAYMGWSTLGLQIIDNISLPLGISFFTFQTMSYTLDVYHGKIKAEDNFIDFAAYVTMFPQLVAGPIVRFAEIREDLKKRKSDLTTILSGVERFIIGLSKKVLIANSLSPFTDFAFSHDINELSSIIALLGLLAYTLQLYFDFSGYSDMAIGLGLMIGIKFPENFNYPYISRSIREFWKRWHITLSLWFRDYLYIPLGGSNRGRFLTHLNLCIVFFVTGLWHGASWNFIMWGMTHGLLIILERNGLSTALTRLPKAVSHFYMLSAFVLSLVFFCTQSMSHAFNYYKALFSFSTGNELLTQYAFLTYLDSHFVFVFILGIMLSLPFSSLKQKPQFKLAKQITMPVLLVLCIVYLNSQSHNPFIYFRF